jgi:signal transduction histidine kinase/ActR/RegA family two-component response regulator
MRRVTHDQSQRTTSGTAVSIRTRLLALVLAIVLPGLLGALWGLNVLYQQQKQAASRNLEEIAQGVGAIVEKELASREFMLKTLALAPSLQQGNLKVFYEFARNAAPGAESTIVLNDLDGQQLINTRVPFGEPLPRSKAFAELRAGARPEEILVSDLYFAPIGKRYSYALQVPVLREKRTAAYLSIGSYAETLQKALEDQRLPRGWNASVVDRKGTIIARRISPAAFVGKPVTDDLMQQLRTRPEGVFETTRLDGVRSFTAYTPIAESGWTFVVSMPKAEVDAQIMSALNLTALITAVLLALAMCAAIYVGRTISRPIRHLVHLAGAVGRGEAIRAPQEGLTETRMVANELQHASERIRASNELMEKRIAEAVAESKRAHDALLQNQKLEALGKLTGGIAHDFNNLLQTISAAVEVALRLAVVDSVKTAMQAAKRAVERATKLTRQLTTFGRGTLSAPAAVDLNGHIRDFRELIEGALRRNIELKIDLPQELWPVYVDPVQLELALLNAALNARDAMPNGGQLRLSAANVKLDRAAVPDVEAGDYVRLTIEDTGAGIPAHDLPRVFEPFYTTKAVGKGSGLGLAQIYGFAKQSSGSVQLDSTEGKGTTLTLFLPRSSQQTETAAETQPARLQGAAAPQTVLFVEDDELVRQVVGPGLQASGFNVVTAVDAASALDAVRANHVDIVLSDIVMPGRGDGFYLAQEIRKSRPDLPIVLATGYSDALTASSPFRILLKPYTLEDARAVLEQELRKARARQARA